MNSKIKIGMFAYSLENSINSILKNFGYVYDKELDMYEYNSKFILEEYKYIDYVICVDETNEFVIIN